MIYKSLRSSPRNWWPVSIRPLSPPLLMYQYHQQFIKNCDYIGWKIIFCLLCYTLYNITNFYHCAIFKMYEEESFYDYFFFSKAYFNNSAGYSHLLTLLFWFYFKYIYGFYIISFFSIVLPFLLWTSCYTLIFLHYRNHNFCVLVNPLLFFSVKLISSNNSFVFLDHLLCGSIVVGFRLVWVGIWWWRWWCFTNNMHAWHYAVWNRIKSK